MTDWLLPLFYFLFFLFIIRRNKFFLPVEISFPLAASAFTLKAAAGILLGYIYGSYYKGQGDTFAFYSDGNILNSFFFSHPADYLKILSGIGAHSNYFFENYYRHLATWYNMPFDFFFNDSRILVRINSVIRFFSFGVYNVHVVFFTFISFTGLTALYRFFTTVIRSHQKIFYAGIFLLPSVAFWGSGVTKEPVVFFSLGMLLWSVQKFISKKNLTGLLNILGFIFLLILSKFYYLIALLPGIISWLWSRNGKNIWRKVAACHTVWLLLLFSVQFVFPDYDVALVISYKQHNFINMAEAGGAGSLMTAEKLQSTWSDVILKAPMAFLTALGSPLDFSFEKPFVALASLETLFILVLILGSVIFFHRQKREDIPRLLFALSFIIITFTLLGLTTAVAGALVRYKVITLPFLMFFIIQLTDISRIKKLFSLT
jgi:hypothetical protein